MSVRRSALVTWVAIFAFSGGAPNSTAERSPTDRTSADRWLIVDCLLPGVIRKLGSRTTYMGARRPVRTSAEECEARGGEYTAYDRASYASSLAVWLPAAEAGDPQAQLNVGVIHERGLGTPPDYASAARWYRRAADAGNVQAMVNLAYLHERGLGVPLDPGRARALYAAAAGVEDMDLEPDLEEARQKDLALHQLSDNLDRLTRENQALAQLLEQTQRHQTALEQAGANDAQASADAAAAQAEVNRLVELNRAQATEIERLRAALSDAEGLAEHRADTLAIHESRLREQQEAIGSALQTNEQLAERLDSETAELRRVLQEKSAALQERQEQIDGLRSRLAVLQQQVAELEQERLEKQRAISERAVAGPSLSLIEPRLENSQALITFTPSERSRKIIGRVQAPAGLLTLLINDTPLSVNAAGVFETDLTYGSLPHAVSLVAVDQQGKRADLRFELAQPSQAASTASTTQPTTSPPVDFGNYHALVIGNDDYQYLPQLETAVNDAREVAELLRDKYGYQTELLLNATRYEVLSSLNRYRETLDSADNLLIYYAGHGELDRVNMRGHWLPVDAEAGNTANWISNVSITDILNVMTAKQVLLIVDSCYAGTLTRSSVSALGTGMTPDERLAWLRKMTEKKARLVLTSGGVAPVLDAGGGSHSVFAKALLEVLRETGGLLEGRQLYQEVTARVAYAATNLQFDQVPEYAPIRFAGHETGEYFFVPKI